IECELRARVQVAGCRAVLDMIEDGREAALQLPGGEEEGPVDEQYDVCERHVVQQADTGERRAGQWFVGPVDSQPIRERCLVGQKRPLLARAMLLAQSLLQVLVFR